MSIWGFLGLLMAVSPGWAAFWSAPVWDSGRAELALYRVETSRYGVARTGEAIIVVVKEPFDLERHVKAGPGATEVTDVLKLNHEVTLPTGIYSYRQMATVQFSRASGDVLKLTTTSQELCGITTKHWRADEPELLHTHSYFDGEGDRDWKLPDRAELVFYDALPVWLRGLGPGAKPVELLLVPPQLSNHATDPTPAKATLSWGVSEEIQTAVGAFTARPVRVKHRSGEDVLHFQEDPPHILVSWERADGSRYSLLNLRRLPYWKHTAPGERRLLDEPSPLGQVVLP